MSIFDEVKTGRRSARQCRQSVKTEAAIPYCIIHCSWDQLQLKRDAFFILIVAKCTCMSIYGQPNAQNLNFSNLDQRHKLSERFVAHFLLKRSDVAPRGHLHFLY